MKRVLILEPYYGGSHKLFLTGLQRSVAADYLLLSLPARKWKMRMQLSALWFVQELKKIPKEERGFDTVLCSTFVDVAVLRALLASVTGWNPATRIVTYFHENQFAYPGQTADPTIRQFTAINFTTAMASDFCAFNSKYNMESFLSAIGSSLKRATDMKLAGCVQEIRQKSVVLYPGMEYNFIDKCQINTRQDYGAAVIVWNHRWEHDKGPELFFDGLYHIQKKGFDFRLIVMGESFGKQPQCFEEAKKRFSKELIHFGYAESREEYAKLLHQGDLIISTAKHEFFGISVLEGIRAGCYPLLPDDLSYPELYGEKYLYKPGKLARSLMEFLKNPVTLEPETAFALTEKFAWNECCEQYRKFLFENSSENK
jgi:glycosyltransferase involved in cell wall biosynthesis